MSTQTKYKFFVSSTYTDLVEARRTLMLSLLEQGHFVVGAELYPTEENGLWQAIQKQIDACDYYVVLVGGRYGSLSPMGLSYTHREYIYASTRKKPILTFMHGQPQLLPEGCRESSRAAQMQLKDFRQLVSRGSMVREWHNLMELLELARSVVPQFVSRHPGEGWVRNTAVKDNLRVEQLQKRVLELEKTLQERQSRSRRPTEPFPANTRVAVHYTGDVFLKGNCKLTDIVGKPSWGRLFACLAPHMLESVPEKVMHQALNEFFAGRSLNDVRAVTPKAHAVRNVRISTESFNRIKVRLRALGVIEKSGASWRLTTYGDHLMTQLLSKPSVNQ